MRFGTLSGLPRRTRARPAAPSEHDEQAALVIKVRVRFPLLSQHMAAVPNGGARHKKTAGDLRAEGVRPGYPDLLIDYPRGPFLGMRIELKRRDGVPSDVTDESRAWGARLNAAGYLAVVGYGCEHAFDQVAAYWDLGGRISRERPTPEELAAFCLLEQQIESLRVFQARLAGGE